MRVQPELSEGSLLPVRRRESIEENFSDVEVLTFTRLQAEMLENSATEIAKNGGPQAAGTQSMARASATAICETLDASQTAAAKRFADGELSLLIFEGMLDPTVGDLPAELPELSLLQEDFHCLRLASRSQILLNLVEHRAFAFDLDSNELVRMVGNFKGGGKTKLTEEPDLGALELSSHTGLALSAHTEPPYHCSFSPSGSHSPAPCALVLTARWNPKSEPTAILPMHRVIERIGAHHALALTAKVFQFTRTDSFAADKGEAGADVSILEIDGKGTFSLRYNSYRFSVSEEAPPPIKNAFQVLTDEVRRTDMVRLALQPSKAIVINNHKALHCRDEIEDNRRLLIRMFGYSPAAQEIVLSDDPLLVQG
ncbi:hypothetical protein GFK26_20550 [Variovorax paradoxus]|uniref:TauD/TfdA-like domain-containing protein n=1 Tax=Variovorax paradoxus TaxID=34073 RepID=A0A5Q0M635_VARPD|nr:hypothetical protein [Variovorax paradoxus]QFZ84983.1 hypothetical protein GFK26_20550 [Variovorax paradoxus]